METKSTFKLKPFFTNSRILLSNNTIKNEIIQEVYVRRKTTSSIINKLATNTLSKAKENKGSPKKIKKR